MKKPLAALCLIVLAGRLIALAGPAFAHARLVHSNPDAGSHVADIDKVVLEFSEKLEPAFSGAELTDGAGNKVAAPQDIAGASITLKAPNLKPGRYRVYWHSVGEDTHRMEGSFPFTVLP